MLLKWLKIPWDVIEFHTEDDFSHEVLFKLCLFLLDLDVLPKIVNNKTVE